MTGATAKRALFARAAVRGEAVRGEAVRGEAGRGEAGRETRPRPNDGLSRGTLLQTCRTRE